ncbi:hypothetical protein EV699_103130 [Plasticicumulans lactativorans]|uniref:CHC2-type zinc finger protein n=1 Tax=Plasticicumulans lactativorans TaxID=1133106 RepID=A0A4R2L7W9_9GAMM|nr:hypothetical protein [Plasticicumulans lactativorans]TCO83081.1 hypothetical protein EV699_103130 [Plasticicumulans lactativorans]
MTPAERLLARLERVKAAGAGRWMARCPAHDDRNPSLAIREDERGRVLVHCHAGCATVDVLAAVGLTLAELFPEQDRQRFGPEQLSTWRRAKLLAEAEHERLILELIDQYRAAGRTLSPADLDRGRQARRRLLAIARALGIGRQA